MSDQEKQIKQTGRETGLFWLQAATKSGRKEQIMAQVSILEQAAIYIIANGCMNYVVQNGVDADDAVKQFSEAVKEEMEFLDDGTKEFKEFDK